nr:primosomal protein N' [Planctomycetota bacterium]
PGYFLTDLCRRAGVSTSPIKTLQKKGLLTLTKERVSSDELMVAADEGEPAGDAPPTPTAEQQEAIDAMVEALDAETFAAHLLLGVTGSGKTEVYLRAIERCRAQGRQAIVLVPEIALTPQTVRRFRRRFERVAVLHSAMTEADRARVWRRIRAGEADVVIGPRSAVFAPVPRLGLIVVDEEHESSFKQQNAPRYHARDVGLVRAKKAGAVVVLGSATPALETYKNAVEGRFTMLRLTARVPGRRLPDVRVVDLRDPDERSSRYSHFSRTLEVRMTEALRAGGQVILLQNRRGFATSVACPRCGYVVPCEHCDVGLTYHRSDHIAMCHLCGHEERVPPACPDCAYPELRYQGVGTQTVEAQLAELFPDARVARMDSDTMATRDAYDDVLGRFGQGEIDVLVGTQMIAKGLDFPNVTLVGIISADTSLALPDFRAAERTFSLVAQVAGRAGRGDVDGRVVVQTRAPDHPAIQLAASQDFEAFAAKELPERAAFDYAPYRRLLRIVVRGPDERAVAARATETRDRIVAAATPATSILGPATPPIPRVQGRYRRHVLVKAPDHQEVARVLAALRSAPRPGGRVEEIWDVDPVGML